jgi:hypothetical protein
MKTGKILGNKPRARDKNIEEIGWSTFTLPYRKK